MIDDNVLWLLSAYRTSEISGALFFGQLARRLKPGAIQMDMTAHFADEAQHARYWTDCIAELGAQPLKLDASYQDKYLAAAGLPANLMEILAITQVFEKRVIRQYAGHVNVPGLQPAIARTFDRILQDEKWHVRWVGDALQSLAPEYGADEIARTLERYRAADESVYRATLDEHQQRLAALDWTPR
jgi:hypothetical protein